MLATTVLVSLSTVSVNYSEIQSYWRWDFELLVLSANTINYTGSLITFPFAKSHSNSMNSYQPAPPEMTVILPGWDLLPQIEISLNCGAIAIYILKIYYVIQIYLKPPLILAPIYNRPVATVCRVPRGFKVSKPLRSGQLPPFFAQKRTALMAEWISKRLYFIWSSARF